MDAYQMVTDKVIEMMQQGLIPWNRPWHGASDSCVSYMTGRPYSMLNQMLLGMRPGEYITYGQCKKLGGFVRKGAKAQFIVFFKNGVARKEETDGEGNTKVSERFIPVLRSYDVFHIEDCEGIKSKLTNAGERLFGSLEPDEAGENVITGYLEREPNLRFTATRSDRAFYSPTSDSVTVPELSQYDTASEYYSTTFHELTHSTGHFSRLNRKQGMHNLFGSEEYSKEELVAEMGAAMLCNVTGIDNKRTFKNSVAYLQGWVSKFKEDKKMIVWAASRAEKAARYILGEQVAVAE